MSRPGRKSYIPGGGRGRAVVQLARPACKPVDSRRKITVFYSGSGMLSFGVAIPGLGIATPKAEIMIPKEGIGL